MLSGVPATNHRFSPPSSQRRSSYQMPANAAGAVLPSTSVHYGSPMSVSPVPTPPQQPLLPTYGPGGLASQSVYVSPPPAPLLPGSGRLPPMAFAPTSSQVVKTPSTPSDSGYPYDQRRPYD